MHARKIIYNRSMQIFSVYKKYTIMPNLQLHMLRAAAVGAYIADRWNDKKQIDKNIIISTLLLHDMGNIIKFELGKFPEILGQEQQKLSYWKNIQQEFFQKYGYDEHLATFAIAREIGISCEVQEVLENMGSSNLAKVLETGEYNAKICMYADLRVAPFGIVSIDKRFDDLIARYQGRDHPIANIKQTEKNRMYCLQIEKQLQNHFQGKLSEISDNSIQSYLNLVKEFELLI